MFFKCVNASHYPSICHIVAEKCYFSPPAMDKYVRQYPLEEKYRKTIQIILAIKNTLLKC